jgi:hypothetical protein
MSHPSSTNAMNLAAKINAYFTKTYGGRQRKAMAGKKVTPEQFQPTITGLALSLGFNSRLEFKKFEKHAELGHLLQRARLRIEAYYEQKLQEHARSGAIFALKNLGWTDKQDGKQTGDETDKNARIVLVETGPELAGDENEVILT